MATRHGRKDRPRVAIIGGGLFGVTAALVLARFCDVQLFERAPGLFQGATFANHNRQHFGFHYPRSLETARQCLASHDDFRRFYRDAELFDFPSYYCVAAGDSKVTPDQYLRFCDEAHLQYQRETPLAGIVAVDKIALAVRVNEGVCDLTALRKLAIQRLEREPTINVRTNQTVAGGRIESDGAKQLTITDHNRTTCEKFDFVINATYAYYNTFCEWFDFCHTGPSNTIFRNSISSSYRKIFESALRLWMAFSLP